MSTLVRFFLITMVLWTVVNLVPQARADINNDVDLRTAMTAPTTQTGVSTGMQEILRYLFLFLKFLAIIASGWGSYQMWKGEFSSGLWAYAATLALFFAPTLVDLAQKIGQSAATG